MPVIVLSSSHLDHGISRAQLHWILEHFEDRNEFFIDEVELPEDLGTVPCGIHGPIMGDEPVPESEVVYEVRGDRRWPSRMVDRPLRPTKIVTVIAGPSGDYSCALYTAYGGHAAPREPQDRFFDSAPQILKKQAEDFWSRHALSRS